jgi:hypothetical protein
MELPRRPAKWSVGYEEDADSKPAFAFMPRFQNIKYLID